MSSYTSSIINKYGDSDNVKRDVKTLREIIGRQGSSLLIDCLAETSGEVAIKFQMLEAERQRLIDVLMSEFKNALTERL